MFEQIQVFALFQGCPTFALQEAGFCLSKRSHPAGKSQQRRQAVVLSTSGKGRGVMNSADGVLCLGCLQRSVVAGEDFFFFVGGGGGRAGWFRWVWDVYTMCESKGFELCDDQIVKYHGGSITDGVGSMK